MTSTNNKWIKFSKGNLKDITLYMTEEYSKNYENGDTDYEMIKNIEDDLPVGKTIFDVGAWIGSSSLVFSKLVGPKGSVVSFEPSPYNLDRMNKNLGKNSNLAKRISTYPIALSDSNSVTRMYLSKNVDNGHSSTSRINNAHSTIRDENLPSGFESVEVNTKRLDDFVSETKLAPDIIKVDIEGAEHLFLIGAIGTLKKFHPTLYIELHSEFCAVRCYEILNSVGYSITILKEEPDNRIMVKAIYSSGKEKTNLNDNILNILSTQDQILRQIKYLDVIEDKLRNANDLIEIKDSAINNLKNELELLKIENESKSIELERILNSKSWKVTKPIRGVYSLKNINNNSRR